MTRARLMLMLLIGTALTSAAARAEQLLMARTQQTFPEAMLALQESIKAHGYTVSRVQRVDIGLTGSGYQTDKYRVVFFGKADEIRALLEKHPALASYVPLKIAIFAEDQDTLLAAMDPALYFAGVDKDLDVTLARWQNDLHAIFAHMREMGD